MNNRQKFRNTLKTIKYTFDFVWKRKKGKKYICIQAIHPFLEILPMVLSVVVPGALINELIYQRRLNVLVLFVAALIVIPFVKQIIVGRLNVFLTKINLDLSAELKQEFNEHVASMNYETLEDPKIQVLRTRARDSFINPLKTIDKLSSFANAIIGLIVVSSIIMTLSPLILVLISLVIIINSLITSRLNYKLFLYGKKISECDRGLVPFAGILTQLIYAKEVRLFDLKKYFSEIILKKETEINKYKLDKQKDQYYANVGHNITNLFQQAILYIYLIFCVLTRGLTVGDMSIFLSSISRVSSSLNNIVNTYIAFSKDSLNIQEMIDFMNIPLDQHNGGTRIPIFNNSSRIEFKNVSFKYPGSDSYALKNVSIVIHSGSKICVVGENGAGKSTFINLLTRLYTPTEGEILLNDININEYDYLLYQKLFSPVLQDFCLYELSLAENIILACQYDEQLVEKVCNKSGLSAMIENLPKSYDTRLGKVTDPKGIIPSGGEAQKIAIARALYRDTPIVILDEPTAALDPLSEYEIYTQFHKMVTDKTAILITHRLSAVQLADKVAVFDNGSVVEYGTHKELYEKSGIYTNMFDKQAQFYRDEQANKT